MLTDLKPSSHNASRERQQKIQTKSLYLTSQKQIQNEEDTVNNWQVNQNGNANRAYQLITNNKKNATYDWIPWFANNKLYLLGWYQASNNSPIRGVEIEMMTMLAQIINILPEKLPNNQTLALRNGNKSILYQNGNFNIKPDFKPLLTISLDATLPHWDLSIYSAHISNAVSSNKSFQIISGMLVASFMMIIISSGWLMKKYAQEKYIEASNKTTFVSNVSHELKTPLTNIRMYAELLSQKRAKSKQKKEKYLSVIVSESERLTRLVNNVLDFNKIEQSRKKYYIEKINLSKDIFTTLENHRLRLEKLGMKLISKYSPQEIFAETDKDVINQVLINLLDNAIKYAKDGKKVGVTLSSNEKYASIEVCDFGKGIPEQFHKKIFEKFFRISNTLSDTQPGCGLGLSISQKMLEDIGGDLTYKVPNHPGACFIITVPLKQES